ncbi:hypothetical protein EIN_224460 [Entamoeba invadens IP1]|uniref:Uncharacterized protein n=1 Tax=Entamoeba invadens IP1 TaxID=370355 RepID=A0A0A1U898_ENTIV|nr:hypothetical protein EIN_224460 [Entamoeba invadens IP1]ELP88203.1 hypothetical protein EIN_224460 [Entamoeba invadens IP1]|eukprot:XP_004254974.1 hypothetical protein EIN_224460 [Entamoeba invadens IP1]
MNYPRALKILVVGGDKTNKSALCKILTGQPPPQNYIHTVGVNIYKSNIGGQSIIYWDIPFAEYKLGRTLDFAKEKVDGIILMTLNDVESSFDAAKDWMKLFANDKVRVLIVSDTKDQKDSKLEELKMIHKQTVEVDVKMINIAKKKFVFETINDFIDKIVKTSGNFKKEVMEESELSSSSATPNFKCSSSPRFFSFSPTRLSNASSQAQKLNEQFIEKSKQHVEQLFGEISNYIEELRKTKFGDGAEEIYKKNELERFVGHVEIEKTTLIKDFDKYEKMVSDGENITITCDDLQRLIEVREHCWQKNFEFIGFNFKRIKN